MDFMKSIEFGEIVAPGMPMGEDELNNLASDLIAVANAMRCGNNGDVRDLCDDVISAAKDAASSLYEMTTSYRDLLAVVGAMASTPWTVRVSDANGREIFNVFEMQESPSECLSYILDGVPVEEAAQYLAEVYGGQALHAVNVSDGSTKCLFDGVEVLA